MTMKYWTDYPFTVLGDISGEKAPVRQVIVHSWDHNKYLTISVLDDNENVLFVTSIKAGYIYTQPGRFGDVPVLKFPRTHIEQY